MVVTRNRQSCASQPQGMGTCPPLAPGLEGFREVGSIKDPISEATSLRTGNQVTKASHRHRLASLPLMPKQGHVKRDNDSGPKLIGKGANLGNG